MYIVPFGSKYLEQFKRYLLTHIIRKDLTRNGFGQITDCYDLP